jgi:methylenetetrahydrofolate dehydrogenase (NADP+)/methenyltetrahydrofolate cyclohydrolase
MKKQQTQVIDGNKIAEKVKDKIVKEVLTLNKNKSHNAEIRPNLAIILIGDNEESKIYVEKKIEQAQKVGVDTHLYKFSDQEAQVDIIKTIEILNEDFQIDAILVQLPLDKKFNTDKIIQTIDPKKDVDCFHPINKNRKKDKIISPVYCAVMEVLREANFNLENKKVLIILNSEFFGKNLKKILEKKGAKVEICLIDDSDIKSKISKADLLITAVGRPHYFKENMLKKGAGVIDIGISRKGKKIKGDFDLTELNDKISFYTPVPGGIGPMTVAFLLKNTLELFKIKNKHK